MTTPTTPDDDRPDPYAEPVDGDYSVFMKAGDREVLASMSQGVWPPTAPQPQPQPVVPTTRANTDSITRMRRITLICLTIGAPLNFLSLALHHWQAVGLTPVALILWWVGLFFWVLGAPTVRNHRRRRREERHQRLLDYHESLRYPKAPIGSVPGAVPTQSAQLLGRVYHNPSGKHESQWRIKMPDGRSLTLKVGPSAKRVEWIRLDTSAGNLLRLTYADGSSDTVDVSP